jgi:phosphohistidine phosphatase SixA
VLDDGIEEGDEEYTYTLVNGEQYEVNPEADEVTFTIVDSSVDSSFEGWTLGDSFNLITPPPTYEGDLTDGEQANADFEDLLEGAELLADLQDGGYVIYIRHAQTERDFADQVTADPNDFSTQRVLSEFGIQQSLAIGEGFRLSQIPYDDVITSDYGRSVKTAAIAFGEYQKDSNLNFLPFEDYTPEQIEEMRENILPLLTAVPDEGTNTVIVGHDDLFEAGTGIYPDPQGIAYILEPDGNGDFEIIANLLPEEWVQLSEFDDTPEVNFSLEPEVAIETEGTVLTWTFTLDKAPSPDGTVIKIGADEAASINRIDLQNATLVGIDNISDLSPNLDFSSFAINITEQVATISGAVLNTPDDEDLNGDGTIEDFGDVAEQITWVISAIAPEDVPEGFGTPGIIGKSSRESITIADNPEQLEPPSFIPEFGTVDADLIEVTGSNQLIFAGGGNDFVDSSQSQGNNRIYLGSGSNIAVLGQGDRVIGGRDDDQFYVTSGGDNTLTGGRGADQFWIATGDFIVNVYEVEASNAYYTFRDVVSGNSDTRLLSDKATAIGFPESFQSVSFLNFEDIPVEKLQSGLISAELKLENNSDLADTLISSTEERPVSVSTYGLIEGAQFDPVNGNFGDIDYGVEGANAISSTSVGGDGVYSWDVKALVADELTNPSGDELSVVLSGVFGNVNTDDRNSYASFYPAGATNGLAPTLVLEAEGINTISDFTIGEDVIGIAGFGIDFDDVSLTQVGENALIGTGNTNFALLLNTDINSLSASDFAFG